MVRIKHRYLLLNILYPTQEKSTTTTKPDEEIPWTVYFRKASSDRLDGRLLLRMIRDGVSELFGDYGAGMVASSLQVKYVSSATSTAIVRVARAHYRLVWAALSFVTKVPKPVDAACVIQVVRVSGTIKKSEEEAVRRARVHIVRARRARAASSSLTTGLPADEDEDLDMTNGIEDHDDAGGQDEDSDE